MTKVQYNDDVAKDWVLQDPQPCRVRQPVHILVVQAAADTSQPVYQRAPRSGHMPAGEIGFAMHMKVETCPSSVDSASWTEIPRPGSARSLGIDESSLETGCCP